MDWQQLKSPHEGISFVNHYLAYIYTDHVSGLPTCHHWPCPSADGTCSEHIPQLLLSSPEQHPQ